MVLLDVALDVEPCGGADGHVAWTSVESLYLLWPCPSLGRVDRPRSCSCTFPFLIPITAIISTHLSLSLLAPHERPRARIPRSMGVHGLRRRRAKFRRDLARCRCCGCRHPYLGVCLHRLASGMNERMNEKGKTKHKTREGRF